MQRISRHFSSLRFRLTACVVAIFALIQTGLWIVVHLEVINHLEQRFEDGLIQRARSVADALDVEQRSRPDFNFRERVLAVIEPLQSSNLYVQVASKQTNEVVKTPNLRGFTLPSPPSSHTTAQGAELHTVEGGLANSLLGLNDAELRLVYLSVDDLTTPCTIQIAASLEPLRRTARFIQQLLIVFIAISLIAAGIATWAVAARSLSPLTRIASDARRISISHLDRRIPQTTGGREVREMVTQINEMLARFEEQFHNQQRFIANVGHELKTPLAVLLGELQLHQRKHGKSDELSEFFNTCEEEIRRLQRTVEGFLILSRVRSRQRLDAVAEVSIEEVIFLAIQRCQKEAKERDVEIVPTLYAQDGAAEPIVPGDPDLLTAMVENLLSNAVRHSPKGESVEVEAEATSREVTIHVRDRGPGIPVESQNRVFELFYQVPQGRLSGKPGIGLAIVKAVSELHGGSVSLSNRQGGGCDFKVVLGLNGRDDYDRTPTRSVLDLGTS